MCTCMKLGVCSHCVYTTVESKIETLGNISAFDVPSKAVCHKCLIKHTCTCIIMCMQDSGSIGREDLHIQFHQKSSRAASD